MSPVPHHFEKALHIALSLSFNLTATPAADTLASNVNRIRAFVLRGLGDSRAEMVAASATDRRT